MKTTPSLYPALCCTFSILFMVTALGAWTHKTFIDKETDLIQTAVSIEREKLSQEKNKVEIEKAIKEYNEYAEGHNNKANDFFKEYKAYLSNITNDPVVAKK